jgi:hypothetical protein
LGAAAVVAVPGSAPPHSPQKRSPGSFAAPHVAHSTAKGAPQCAQNRLPSRFSPPHASQLATGQTPPGRSGRDGERRAEQAEEVEALVDAENPGRAPRRSDRLPLPREQDVADDVRGEERQERRRPDTRAT